MMRAWVVALAFVSAQTPALAGAAAPAPEVGGGVAGLVIAAGVALIIRRWKF